MLRAQLNQAVSRATGEDYNVISGRGFSLVSDESPLLESDFDALIDDWLEMQSEQLTPVFQEPRTLRLISPISGIRMNGSKKVRKSRAPYRSRLKPMGK